MENKNKIKVQKDFSMFFIEKLRSFVSIFAASKHYCVQKCGRYRKSYLSEFACGSKLHMPNYGIWGKSKRTVMVLLHFVHLFFCISLVFFPKCLFVFVLNHFEGYAPHRENFKIIFLTVILNSYWSIKGVSIASNDNMTEHLAKSEEYHSRQKYFFYKKR